MSATDKVKLPEPVRMSSDQGYLGYTSAQMLAMHEQGRLAGLEEAAEACDDVEEPRYYGYENPNTFSDGKAACISAIRSLAAASIGAKMGEK